MAINRPGAVRKAGTKKGPTKGSGGKGRRALEGKGPTPKAEDRVYHVAYKRKQEALAAERKEAARSRPKVGRPASRKADGDELIVGRNSVLEALRTGVPITTLYVANRIEHDDRTKEILQLAASRGLGLLETTKPELDRLADGQVHQGIVAKALPYEYADVEDLLDAIEARRADGTATQAPLLVALDGVTDPRNLGAIIRSAGAFGADGVVVPARRAAGVTAAAWKASAGAAARVPVAKATNLTRTLTDLKKAGLFVVGLDGHAPTRVADLQFSTDPMVLVVGSEGNGLSRLVRETCDAIVSIPIDGTVESLNASVATAIALYEIAQARSAVRASE